jgi:hypothetical protein
MLGPAGRIAGIYDRVHEWASKPGGNGVTPLDHDDVRRLLGEIKAIWRINELFNWQVAASGRPSTSRRRCHQGVFDRADPAHRPVGRGDRRQVRQPRRVADRRTAGWLDSQTKRNLVITFGGGVNEVMREQVAASGLKVPRVPR